MRDLTVSEIEGVSGAGWQDWFGGVREQVVEHLSTIVEFFKRAPIIPNEAQQKFIRDYCQYGLQSLQMSEGPSSASLSFGTKSGASMSITLGGGTLQIVCMPPP